MNKTMSEKDKEVLRQSLNETFLQRAIKQISMENNLF